MSNVQINQIIGARLDRVVLFAASVSLHFEHADGRRIQLSTSCDILVVGDPVGVDYPLSVQAFVKLASAIDGDVESLVLNADGDYELTIAGSSVVIRDEQAMDGVFGVVVRNADGVMWEASFEGGRRAR